VVHVAIDAASSSLLRDVSRHWLLILVVSLGGDRHCLHSRGMFALRDVKKFHLSLSFVCLQNNPSFFQ
jgi:hypothetical protein